MEENLLRALERREPSGKEKRRPIAEVLPIAKELVAALEALPGVERAQYCGSLRRFRETIADVDKAHNIKLRQRALARGWLLNEYGLQDNKTGEVIAAASEEAIYEALGLQFVPPPMREDHGEFERAEDGDLLPAPRLEDLNGDLHVHTSLSGDGRSNP